MTRSVHQYSGKRTLFFIFYFVKAAEHPVTHWKGPARVQGHFCFMVALSWSLEGDWKRIRLMFGKAEKAVE